MNKKTRGLTEKEAKRNLEKYGYNEIQEVLEISAWKILLRQVKKNFVVYLLLSAAIISFFIDKQPTAYAVLFIILIIVLVGFFQEYKAENSIKSLKKMIMPVSVVVRNNKEIEIPSREITPEDIVLLRTGEKVPADCLILEEKELRVDESVLTGESKEISKKQVKNENNYDKENIVFMGSLIVNGKCKAKVLHSGMNTEFGKIAGLISTAEKELPLQKKVNNIAKYMAIIGASMAILTGLVFILRNAPLNQDLFFEALILVVVIAVASFPEGFPLVLISSLARGAYRMSKKNAIVNRMSIIETLGETTVICSDKTGTITTGEMTVKKVFTDNTLFDVSGAGYNANGDFLIGKDKVNIENENSLNLLTKAGVFCNDTSIQRTGEDMQFSIKGNPTEASLLVLASKLKTYKEDLNFERYEEIPFNSERKMMSVLVKENKKEDFVYTKGALETLLEKCKYIQRNNGVFSITKKDIKKILEENKKMTSDSFRTLALAYKPIKKSSQENLEDNLIFLGIVGIEDSPREEVFEAVESCYRAGIKIKMITGDDKETAISIGKKIGLKKGEVITGKELDELTDDELSKIVKDIVIFARVRPEHKIKIVRALKENKEIVTMTGDGVNDAPALKEAHIGVAMGIKGTDVSRESSDLILKDDNFATIVEAIKEGRTIFNNIQKFSTYQIAVNFSQVALIFLAVAILGLPTPLLPLQVLFMNILSDETTAITLGFNPPSLDAMQVKPRRKTNILDKESFKMIVMAGLPKALSALAVFFVFYSVLNRPEDLARTMSFLVMVLFGLTLAFNFRSFRYPVYKLPFKANKYLVYACVISLIATLIVIYTPLRAIEDFGNVAIPLKYWILPVLISILPIIIFDVWKTLKAKGKGFDNHSGKI